MFDSNIFEIKTEKTVPESARIVFVSDAFCDDYVGGAELTTQALIDSSPLEVFKIHSKDVSMKTLESGHQKFWIFGNFSALDWKLIPAIIANMKYSVLEYDYKFCRYRSPEKHKSIENTECKCHDEQQGKIVSAFYHGARSLWWMSEKQMETYHKRFPFLSQGRNTVLSSVFDEDFFLKVNQLREKYKDCSRDGWVILGSNSWIKGYDEAVAWCEQNKKEYEVVWNVPYFELLEKLAQAEGLVFLPNGADTCPRLVIEAKLLGCKLHINDNVQHKDELWFDTDDMFDTEAYLYAARENFWNGIKADMEFDYSLSGYTTVLNCNKNNYPWRQTIHSLLGFCDEVCVADGGSTDGTWEELKAWAEKEERLVIYQNKIDLEDPRFAIKSDGLLKGLARSMCTKEFCWQMDCDEIVHEDDYSKIKDLCKQFQNGLDLIAMPVIEYWGGAEKVRADINPWKWRISRNKSYITHGPPAQLRKYDQNGELYCAKGTDSCDYIRNDNYQPIQFGTFYTEEVHNCRIAALQGDQNALSQYEAWFNAMTDMLPSVHHFSWWDMERKIKNTRDHWSKFWGSMYNESIEDTPENNKMFDYAWKDVTEEMIKERADEFVEKLGGWIWHQKWDGVTTTPHIKSNKKIPAIMNEWIES
jgi:glycosyltransferase involved in cell wall biosynthesis